MGWSIGTGIGPLRYSMRIGGKHYMSRGATGVTRGMTGLFVGVFVLTARIIAVSLALMWLGTLIVFNFVVLVIALTKHWQQGQPARQERRRQEAAAL